MNLFGHKNKIDADSQIMLTEEGKREADTYVSQAPPYRILSALHERSPRNVRDISTEANMDVEEAKEWIKKLEKQGYTRVN